MIWIAFIGALILGWSLGRNNLSNLFGAALGTRMVQAKTAVGLAIIFIFIGAFSGSMATTRNVVEMSALKTPLDIVVVVASAALMLEVLSSRGIPASIVQTVVGAIIGWNLYHQATVDWLLVQQMVAAWFIAPFFAAGISWSLMKIVRWGLQLYPVSLLMRDSLVRWGLIGIGMMASYTLGANNIGTITGPYLTVFPDLTVTGMTALVCTAIGIGCLMADQKVIATVSRKLFPLSPMEALIVMIGTTLCLFCFSVQSLRDWLVEWRLPTFPLVPIPMSSIIIGAICGISLAKGGYGLRFSVLGHIIFSWFLVPVAAGILCYSFLILWR